MEIKLKANIRKKFGKAVKNIIDQNKIPAVIYGPKSDNKNIELNYTDFVHVFDAAGKSTLINLEIDDQKPVKVLVHDFSQDPVKSRYNHIDFYELDLTKKLKVNVELNLVGESPAVKEQNAELIKILDTIEVECLPENLVKSIDVDLSALKNLSDHIYTRDLALPKGLELISDPNLVIVSAEEIRETIIEEEKPAEEEAEEDGEGKAKEGEAETGSLPVQDKKPEDKKE